MEIYFIRHGESEANILREFSNRGVKHPLTMRGREQARILAETFVAKNVIAVYSSPLLRAQETAEIICGKLGIKYVVDRALREWDAGVLEGKSDEESWRSYQELMDDWQLRGRRDQRMEDGESLREIQGRFVALIDRIVTKYGNEDGCILCVGHGGLYQCALPASLSNVELSDVRHSLSNTGWARCALVDGQLRCIEWQGHRTNCPTT